MPAPMLLSHPVVGGTLLWPDGKEVEEIVYQTPGDTPAVYKLVRIR